ncbi:MAG: hypothetical protein ACPKQO_09530 [Nitrososphaeraceae archaeon]
MLALVFPSIFIIIYGIVLAGINISLRNIHYLIILSNLKSQFLNRKHVNTEYRSRKKSNK